VIWELREGDMAIYIHAQVDYAIPKGYLEHHIVARAMDNLITRQEIDLSKIDIEICHIETIETIRWSFYVVGTHTYPCHLQDLSGQDDAMNNPHP
jgi:hypothetical protein